MDRDSEEARRRRAEVGETVRLETFADGVMAIAATLLILDIDVPGTDTGATVGRALIEQWPAYVAYAVSFLTIGIIWVNHHHLFSVIERVDNMFLILNVIFLMTIAALPWPTGLVAEHLRHEEARTVATVVYGGTMILIAVMFNIVWRYAASGLRLLPEDVDREQLGRVSRIYLSGPIAYLAATLLAFASSWLSLGAFAIIALYWLFPSAGPTLTRLRPDLE